MTTYADPSRCPDCRAPLPEAPQVCPRCALPLTGPTAVELFATLQRADLVLVTLRQLRQPAPRPAPAVVVGAHAPASALGDAAAYPTHRRHGASEAARPDLGVPRVTGTSVPKILLSLGALCLLVAAVTFLAVAWAWLGVGGRTVVLLALTAGAFGGACASAGRGLRMAGEALAVVGLGLVSLDVVGARHAGWLGDLGDAGLLTTIGSVVATTALAMLLLTLPKPLVSPALVAPFAVLVAGVGAQVPVDEPVPMLVATLVLLGLGRVGVTAGSTPLWISSMTAGAFGWLYVLFSGLGRAVADDTVQHLWSSGAVWPLVAAVAVAAAAGPVVGLGRVPTLAGYSLAALIGTFVVVLPALDNSPTAATLSLLPCVLGWAAVATFGPQRLRPAAVLPLVGVAVLPAAAFLDLALTALHATLEVGAPFTEPFGVHVGASLTWVAPWLAGPTLAALATAGCTVVAQRSPLRHTTWLVTLGAAVVVGGVVTLPLYDVALAVVVAVLLVVACAGFAVAERLPGGPAAALRIAAAAPGLLAVVAAAPNAALSTCALAAATAVCLHLIRRTDLTGEIAAAGLSFALGGLMWAGGEALSVAPVDRAVPILLVLGGLAIWRPEPAVEASAAVVGAVASFGALAAAVDTASALALQLTVAGALVTASSLIHPTRRILAWPGGLLLAMATWVRLWELGVTMPEAYTLPSALVLTGLGIRRVLRGDDRSDTMSLLAPGLTLATLPSLLVCLDDPTSTRALLLGVGCLVLVLAGVALRWSAPLVVGSLVGAVLVLRELAPYAADLPSWVVIGLSGTLLLVVGVTWESRMRDARTATRYVAHLR